MLIEICWLAIALLVHGAPALILVRPNLVDRLYGIQSDQTVGLLLIHRGAMFLGIVAVGLFAAFDPSARQAATIVTATSMIGFLFLYAKSGFPTGSLRKIAIVDLLGMLPLSIVSMDAWFA